MAVCLSAHSVLRHRPKHGAWDLAYYFPIATHEKFDESGKVIARRRAVQPQWLQMKNDFLGLFFNEQLVWQAAMALVAVAISLKKDPTQFPLVIGAIAFSARAVSPGATATSVTLAHTPTGSNSVVTGLGYVDNGEADISTSMVWNGNDMGAAFKKALNAGAPLAPKAVYGYSYANGTADEASYNLVWTVNTSKYLYLHAYSFNGAKQTGIPDSSAIFNIVSSGGTENLTTTVVAADSMLCAIGADYLGNIAAGSGTTMNLHADSNNYDARSTATVGSGSQSLAVTMANTDHTYGIVFSLAPVVSASKDSNIMLMMNA